MSERIDEILEVLGLIWGSGGQYVTRRAVRERRLAALKEVANRRQIAPETVRDKFGRQLRPDIPGVNAFDRLVEEWLAGRPDGLRSVLVKHAVSGSDERRIREFFAARASSDSHAPA